MRSSATSGSLAKTANAFLRRVRAKVDSARTLPSLALSRSRGPRDKQRAREAGFNGHLAKPVDPTALLRKLAELVPHGAQLAGDVAVARGDARTA